MNKVDLSSPRAWLSALRQDYANSLEAGSKRWRLAQADVDAGRVAPELLAKVAIKALETMKDSEPTSLGMAACEALRRCGGESVIRRLRKVQGSLPARPGLRDWRVDASHALAVVEARASHTCTCGAEAAKGAAVYDDQWVIDREAADSENYCVLFDLHCSLCGQHWKVRREDSYHYPIFSWSRGASAKR